MGLKRTRVARRVFVVGVGVVAAAPPNHSMVCSRGALRGCSSRPCYGRRGCGTATCERSRARAAGGQTMLWFARGPGGGKFALEQTIVWFVPARRGPCNMQARPRRAGRAPAAQAVPHRKARARPARRNAAAAPRGTTRAWYVLLAGAGGGEAAAKPRHALASTNHSMVCSRGPAAANPRSPLAPPNHSMDCLRGRAATKPPRGQTTAVACASPFAFNKNHGSRRPAPTRWPCATAGQRRPPPCSRPRPRRRPRRRGACWRRAAVRPAARAPAAAPPRAGAPGRSDRASSPAGTACATRRRAPARTAPAGRAHELVRQPGEVRPVLVRELDVPAAARPPQADAPPVHVVHVVVVAAPQRERLLAQERVELRPRRAQRPVGWQGHAFVGVSPHGALNTAKTNHSMV